MGQQRFTQNDTGHITAFFKGSTLARGETGIAFKLDPVKINVLLCLLASTIVAR